MEDDLELGEFLKIKQNLPSLLESIELEEIKRLVHHPAMYLQAAAVCVSQKCQ